MKGREDYLWLTVSDVPIHGQQAPRKKLVENNDAEKLFSLWQQRGRGQQQCQRSGDQGPDLDPQGPP